MDEDLLPEEMPPQSHATQCDEMGVLAEGGGAILTVMAAGGFHASDTERTVYCRLRLGHHEAETGSLPSHPPEAAKDAPPPVCLFEQAPGTALVLLDCFAKGERSDTFTPSPDAPAPSVHRGWIHLPLEEMDDERTPRSQTRFFRLEERTKAGHLPDATGGNAASGKQTARESERVPLKKTVSYGFGNDSQSAEKSVESSRETARQSKLDTGMEEMEQATSRTGEVYADQHSGVPTKETCPHGWVAVRYSYFPRAGDAKGRERTRLEQAAIPILAANTEAVGRLSITIRCARRLSQLASTSLLSKLLDPFLQIVYKGRSYSTSVAFNSSEPRWDETFSFEVSDLNAELQLKVFDWKAEAERYDLIGAACLSIGEELEGDGAERWISLFTLRRDGTIRRRGEVLCGIALAPKYAAQASSVA